MNFIEARDIIYQQVCDVTDKYDPKLRNEFRQTAYKMEELDTIVILLESDLSCSKFKALESYISFIKQFWDHPIHKILTIIAELSSYQAK
jgi:hypothetical protein